MNKKTAAVLTTEIALTLMVGVIVLFACLAIFSGNLGGIFKNTNMKKLFNKEAPKDESHPSLDDLSILNAGMQGSILIEDFKELLIKINEALNNSAELPEAYIATLNLLKQSILMAIATNDDYKRVSLSKNKEEVARTETLLTNAIKDVFDKMADVDKSLKELALADYKSLEKITAGASGALIKLEFAPALVVALSDEKAGKPPHIEEFYDGTMTAPLSKVGKITAAGEVVYAPETKSDPLFLLNIPSDLFINEPDSGLNNIQIQFGSDKNDWVFFPNPHPLTDMFTDLNALLNDKNLSDTKIAAFLENVITKDADKKCTVGLTSYLLDSQTYNEPYDAHLEGTYHVSDTGISDKTKYCSNRLSRHISSLIAIEQFQDIWVLQLVYWHLNRNEPERASELLNKYSDRFTDEYLQRYFKPVGSYGFGGREIDESSSVVSSEYIEIMKLIHQITKSCVEYRLHKAITSNIKPELLKVKKLVEKYSSGKDLSKQSDVAKLYTEIMASEESREDKELLNKYINFKVVY